MRTLVIGKNNFPVYCWIHPGDIEEGALKQIENVASLSFVKKVAIMPDVHQGYGVPIGSIVACEGRVIPNAVGVDIGCGVRTEKIFSKKANLTKEDFKKITDKIYEEIPLGFNRWNNLSESEIFNRESKYDNLLRSVITLDHAVDLSDSLIIVKERKNAISQLGTLGGGNHFIEFQRDEESGDIYLTIHTGSRNLGKTVADYYNNLAKELPFEEGKDLDLASLDAESEEGKKYLAEADFCGSFAHLNRSSISRKIRAIVDEILPHKKHLSTLDYVLDTRHNFVHYRNIDGKGTLGFIHRKGAIFVPLGHAVIPGSQGSKTFIVSPQLRDKEIYFNSMAGASHGAGRKMGRGRAKRELDFDREVEILNSQDIVHKIKSKDDLDEATGAYKDIDEVMENQTELVYPIKTLIPLAVIKG